MLQFLAVCYRLSFQIHAVFIGGNERTYSLETLFCGKIYERMPLQYTSDTVREAGKMFSFL